jgi:hypothetical protein
VPGTPATVMISPDGIIKEIWIGAYSGAAQKKIEATVHVQLPGTTM